MKRIQRTNFLVLETCVCVLSIVSGCNDGQRESSEVKAGSSSTKTESFKTTVDQSLALQQDIIEEAAFAAIGYSLTNESAKALVRADSIPRRPESFGIEDPMTELVFLEYSESEAKNRLTDMAAIFIGDQANTAEIVDNESSLAAKLQNGFAYISKSSGAFAVGIYDTDTGPTIVKNAEEAVNLALGQIADLDILKLAAGESLDVIAISSTHNVGWRVTQEGETLPLYLDVEGSAKPVTEFKSSYSVVFGRRFRDVPIIDSKLVIRLDHKGRLVSFKRRWRDIDEGKSGKNTPVALLSDSEVVAARKLAGDPDFELEGVQCGYVEASVSGYTQSSAGIGCKYLYFNEKKRSSLAAGRAEWVNIAADNEAFPLKGQKLSFQPAAD